MNRPVVRRIAIGELLDRTFALYRRHFALLTGIAGLPALLLALLALGLRPPVPDPGSLDPAADPAEAIRGLAALLAAMLAGLFAGIVTLSVAGAATVGALSAVSRGRSVRIADAYAGVAGRWGDIVALGLALGVMAVGAILLVTLAAMAVGAAVSSIHPLLGAAALLIVEMGGLAATFAAFVRYAVSIPALVLERLRPGAALRRSADLTRGERPRVALVGVLMMLIGSVATVLLEGPFLFAETLIGTAAWVRVLGGLSEAAAGALTVPLLLIAMTLLHESLKAGSHSADRASSGGAGSVY